MKTKYIYAFLGLLLVAFMGCSDNDSNAEGVGKLSIQLTDAPFPHDMIAEANVTIFKIEARTKDENDDEEYETDNEDENGEDTMDEHESNGKYLILMEEEITVNLLELTNGVTETLFNADIPSGTYDMFRVYVKGVNVVLNDENSTTYDLKVPSGEHSGIKIFVKPPLVITNGLSADLLFDFDVCRSFVPRGNIKHLDSFNGFNFKPVIKIRNLTTAGTLQGMVTTVDGETVTPLNGAQITVLKDGEIVTTSLTDDTGGYMIMGLETGSYIITVEKEGYILSPENEGPTEAVIDAGNRTTINFVMTPNI